MKRLATRVVARTPPAALVILGQPVTQSLSPVFQTAALQAAGLTVSYARQEVAADELRATLAQCREAQCGGNVTMPHKQAVFALATHCTPVAQRTGAVNTFWWDDGHLMGHNTDVDGVAATIRALSGHSVNGDVVLLGAGGSASAVLVALESVARSAESRVIVLARTPERATALVRQVGINAIVESDAAAISWKRVSLVINATPAGMHAGDAPPLDLAHLASDTAVFDLVYNREGTQWVNEAKTRGLIAEDGLRMLVEQGAAAFETWFGVPAPREAMWRALGTAMPDPQAPRA